MWHALLRLKSQVHPAYYKGSIKCHTPHQLGRVYLTKWEKSSLRNSTFKWKKKSVLTCKHCKKPRNSIELQKVGDGGGEENKKHVLLRSKFFCLGQLLIALKIAKLPINTFKIRNNCSGKTTMIEHLVTKSSSFHP